MTISKERAEELRVIFLNNLRNEFEEALSYYGYELERNPKNFLKHYYNELISDSLEEIGLRSVQGYYHVNFPLRLKDFTEEELEYFKL